MTEVPFAVLKNFFILKFVLLFRVLKQEPLKRPRSPILLALVWVDLNSLKPIYFKGRFLGIMRNVYYVR